jgi:hypothetical protein
MADAISLRVLRNELFLLLVRETLSVENWSTAPSSECLVGQGKGLFNRLEASVEEPISPQQARLVANCVIFAG